MDIDTHPSTVTSGKSLFDQDGEVKKIYDEYVTLLSCRMSNKKAIAQQFALLESIQR
jgi:hypothetical protein